MNRRLCRLLAPPALLALLLALPACAGSGTATRDELAASFRSRHDAVSLNRLLGFLHLGMPRAEVERLLGPATYSPIDGQSYYATSDNCTPEGTPIGLVVEYRRFHPRHHEQVSADQLESLWYGPIAE